MSHVDLKKGSDGKMHCWDSSSGLNSLVNYGEVINRTKQSVQLAMSREGSSLHLCRHIDP